MTRPAIRPSLFAHALEKLGSDIVQGKFAGTGSLPREHDLCTYLGVSRSVMREVTRVLAQKGMLQALPKVGIKVRPEAEWNLMDIDVLNWLWRHGKRAQYVKDFLEFRLAFEPIASYQAALRATPEQRKAILDLCDKVIAANATLSQGGDIMQAIACDLDFHSAIFKASGNRLLTHLGGMISEIMARQVIETTAEPGSFAHGLPLHQSVARAIDAGDAVAAHHYSQLLVRMPYEDYLSKHIHDEPPLGTFGVKAPEFPVTAYAPAGKER